MRVRAGVTVQSECCRVSGHTHVHAHHNPKTTLSKGLILFQGGDGSVKSHTDQFLHQLSPHWSWIFSGTFFLFKHVDLKFITNLYLFIIMLMICCVNIRRYEAHFMFLFILQQLINLLTKQLTRKIIESDS